MATMIETLPVEIQDHAREMEKHLHEFLDNLGSLKEVLAVTMYRLECTRKLVEKNGTIEEAKALFKELGMI